MADSIGLDVRSKLVEDAVKPVIHLGTEIGNDAGQSKSTRSKPKFPKCKKTCKKCQVIQQALGEKDSSSSVDASKQSIYPESGDSSFTTWDDFFIRFVIKNSQEKKSSCGSCETEKFIKRISQQEQGRRESLANMFSGKYSKESDGVNSINQKVCTFLDWNDFFESAAW